jgi:putative ABC transport system permease protein
VALVNEAFARRFLAGVDPIGRRLVHELVLTEGEPSEREIVGVVGDVRYYELQAEPPPQIYLPHLQTPWTAAHLVVRGRGGPAALGAALRGAVAAIDPEVAVSTPRPLREITAAALAAPRLRTELLASFGAVALALAALGLYGLLSFGVSQRSREIGVRVALGARRGELLRMVLREGMALVALGLGLGLVASAALARLVSGLLYAIAPLDPVAWLLAPALLVCVSLVACWIPARRAAGLDPLLAIRSD